MISPTRQSGVIPYRHRRDAVQVLMVTNCRGDRWIVPKGNVEQELSPQESAAQEALEEAGVAGIVDPACVGSYRYAKREVIRVVDLYPMEVTATWSSWLEMGQRRRIWMSLPEAIDLASFPDLSVCILNLARRLFADILAA